LEGPRTAGSETCTNPTWQGIRVPVVWDIKDDVICHSGGQLLDAGMSWRIAADRHKLHVIPMKGFIQITDMFSKAQAELSSRGSAAEP